MNWQNILLTVLRAYTEKQKSAFTVGLRRIVNVIVSQKRIEKVILCFLETRLDIEVGSNYNFFESN